MDGDSDIEYIGAPSPTTMQRNREKSAPYFTTASFLRSYEISLRDPSIQCTCLGGTVRRTDELIFVGMGDHGPTFIHVVCNPHLTALGINTVQKVLLNLDEKTDHDLEGLFLAVLGADPTPKQRVKVKNFTSSFICDGPCRGSKSIKDYIICKKCCTWQHKSCMLYGDIEISGRPVCNRCYLDFVIFHDDVVRAQRKRLLLVVKLAYRYLKNPENRHEVWRRTWCRNFLARFMTHHQAHYHRWVASRRFRMQNHLALNGSVNGATERIPLDECEDEVSGRRSSFRKGKGRALASAPVDFYDADMQEEPMSPSRDDEDDSDYIPDHDEALPSRSKPERTAGRSKSFKHLTTGHSPVQPTIRNTLDQQESLNHPSSTMKSSRSTAPRKSVRTYSSGGEQDVRMESDGENREPNIVLEHPLNVNQDRSDHRMYCKCDVTPVPKDSFKCVGCRLLQHYRCADDNQDGVPMLCNFCFNRPFAESTLQPISSKQPFRNPPALITGTPDALFESPEELDKAIREELDQLCATMLWEEYCNLNTSRSNSISLVSSKTAKRGSKTPRAETPKYPPIAWLEEMQARTRQLLDAASHDQITVSLVPALSAFPRQPCRILNALRETALKQLFHSSNALQRADLGILLEVLGFEEKGTYWKGCKIGAK